MPIYPDPQMTLLTVGDSDISLEIRTQDPSDGSVRGLAVLAHPLGRLGGSMDDRVVRKLESLMRNQHFRTVCFNSRGVGQSTGSASWTGASECQDAEQVVGNAVQAFCRDYPAVTGAQIVFVGYSAGALYGSTVRLSAHTTSAKQFQGKRPAYVLVSYPIDMVWALSIFRSSTYQKAIESLLTDTHEPSYVLLIHGTHDQLSKTANYDKWTTGLQSVAQQTGTLKVVSVVGADHFWGGNSLASLTSSMQDFVSAPSL